MAKKKDALFLPPSDLLVCPRCGSDANHGLNLDSLKCGTCKLDMFAIGGVPCFFPNGTVQKDLWEHQIADLINVGKQSLQALETELSRYDLSPNTRKRLEKFASDNIHGQELTLQLLQETGLKAKYNEQYQSLQGALMTEYYEQILRDWAWGDAPSVRFDVNENNAALQRALDILDVSEGRPQKILVLGAGAGRLSWDLHAHLRPELTIALDSNPLLLTVSNKLIRRRRSVDFTGFREFPQFFEEDSKTWTMEPPFDPDNLRDSWFAFGANAWHVPFKAHQFDLVVTPWFIDVNGGEVRDLIGLIQHFLKPGGQWLNSGPLLYARSVPTPARYSGEEIRELIELAGFSFGKERLDMGAHLVSPLDQRFREEQLWTFSAKAPQPDAAATTDHPAPWLIIHHLPIPKGEYKTKQEHPLISSILALIDGTLSINQLSQKVAHMMPEGVPPKEAVVALLGEIIEQREGFL